MWVGKGFTGIVEGSLQIIQQLRRPKRLVGKGLSALLGFVFLMGPSVAFLVWFLYRRMKNVAYAPSCLVQKTVSTAP